MYAELDTLSEESYKDSTLIMQLLRDNLVSSWCTSIDAETVLTCDTDSLDFFRGRAIWRGRGVR